MLNGTIMSEDIPVLEYKNNHITILNKKLLPLYFNRSDDVENWLEKRAIDSHRTNSRLLKRMLRLTQTDDLNTVLSVNGVTLTDNYWFKKEGFENLTWEDVRFKENEYSLVALNGDINGFFKNPSKTPELTNIGSYEKCWKLEDGNWWLYKRESKTELFSELFIYYLGKKLGFNMAEYEYDKENYIKSKDFTDGNKVNFESMYSLTGDIDEYSVCYNSLNSLNSPFKDNILTDYIKMIYLDTLVLNGDRHSQNFGIFRNKKTGEVLSLAPNFDNNIALIATSYPRYIERENDLLINLFCSFLKENTEARNIFIKTYKTTITKEFLDDCIKEMPEDTTKDIDVNLVKDFIVNGFNRIDNFIKQYI